MRSFVVFGSYKPNYRQFIQYFLRHFTKFHSGETVLSTVVSKVKKVKSVDNMVHQQVKKKKEVKISSS